MEEGSGSLLSGTEGTLTQSDSAPSLTLSSVRGIEWGCPVYVESEHVSQNTIEVIWQQYCYVSFGRSPTNNLTSHPVDIWLCRMGLGCGQGYKGCRHERFGSNASEVGTDDGAAATIKM